MTIDFQDISVPRSQQLLHLLGVERALNQFNAVSSLRFSKVSRQHRLENFTFDAKLKGVAANFFTIHNNRGCAIDLLLKHLKPSVCQNAFFAICGSFFGEIVTEKKINNVIQCHENKQADKVR